MESEALFTMINSLSYPLLGVSEEYKHLYSNLSMKALLNAEDENVHLDKSLLLIIKKFSQMEDTKSYIFHEVDIFESVYTVHMNRADNGIFAIFVESKKEDMFENLTFHEATGTCNTIMVILNDKGNIVDANDCFSNFVGMKKEETLSKNFFENFIPGNIEQLSNYFQSILSNDSFHQHFITPMKGYDNDIYRINWQVSKLIKQKQTYIVAVGSDVSKFLKENSTLKQQLKSIKLGFEYFPFSIGYMNAKGVFTSMNARFLKLFGIKESQNRVEFDEIELFHKQIGFANMKENIKFFKEMHYKINAHIAQKNIQLKVDIRMLSGKKESSKFYIVVVQRVKE